MRGKKVRFEPVETCWVSYFPNGDSPERKDKKVSILLADEAEFEGVTCNVYTVQEAVKIAQAILEAVSLTLKGGK